MDMKNISIWQKCPVCDASGRVSLPLSNNTFETCTVCKGTKIISTITGKPPVQ